ncbi:MAG: site-2 protease family protein [Chloroflexaceae bacterium]|nr:site-2 protease family protein [Chloroflexaceae bacterium]NJO05715.1 site-2 protease family protein [Chloroflexaceae bacterium]
MDPQYEYQAARQREDLRLIAAEIMDVRDVKHVPPPERGAIRLAGRLLVEPESAYDYVQPRFRALGYTAMLHEDPAQPDGVTLLALPGEFPQSRPNIWLAGVLFLLTIASTIFVGGAEVNGFNWGLGLAFSASILSILFAHEMGHFIVARRLGVQVSYPYFIPMPLTPIGTMGAVISMKSPPANRSHLLAVGIAGPLAGLVVAMPVLFIGLSLSEVQSMDAVREQTSVILMEGNSIIYALSKILVFGRFLPSGGDDVLLHPVAFAGWVGLLVTGLNLIPAGQLDGGHIFYALFGRRLSRRFTWGLAALLFAMGFLWGGWFLWSFLIIVFGQRQAPLLNELTPMTRGQRILAIIGLVLFVLVFTPVPFQVIEL